MQIHLFFHFLPIKGLIFDLKYLSKYWDFIETDPTHDLYSNVEKLVWKINLDHLQELN